jgi:oxalate decarboxylase/phosphoglucose isomerase-like protein (cupin superfamily)
MIPPPSEYNDPKMQSSSLSGAEPVFSTITLLPGDAIFVPKDYWHSIQTKSKASIALNWYFDPVEKEGNRSSKRRKLEDTDQSENLYRDDKV